MASDNQQTPTIRPPSKWSNSSKKNSNEQQQIVLDQVMEMFGSIVDPDIVLNVVENCRFQLQPSIDALIMLSENVDSTSTQSLNHQDVALMNFVEKNANRKEQSKSENVNGIEQEFPEKYDARFSMMNEENFLLLKNQMHEFAYVEKGSVPKKFNSPNKNTSNLNCSVERKISPPKLQQYSQAWNNPHCNAKPDPSKIYLCSDVESNVSASHNAPLPGMKPTQTQLGIENETIDQKVDNNHQESGSSRYDNLFGSKSQFTCDTSHQFYKKGTIPKNCQPQQSSSPLGKNSELTEKLALQSKNSKSKISNFQNLQTFLNDFMHNESTCKNVEVHDYNSSSPGSANFQVKPINHESGTKPHNSIPQTFAQSAQSQTNAKSDSNKGETKSLCGLKVQYRRPGLENSSDDDADVVIEEETTNYPVKNPPEITVNVCQFLSSSTQSSTKNTHPGLRMINTPSPPRSPQQNTYNATFKKIISSIVAGHKILILLRGLPGSGKSHLAQTIVRSTIGDDSSPFVFSTDNYFVMIHRGAYQWSPLKLADAHQWTQEKVLDAMKAGVSPIIVDNTNLEIWEMQPYVVMGVQHGYLLEVLETNTPWNMNINELARRNAHGVPKDKLRRMIERYDRNVTPANLIKQFSLNYTNENAPPQMRTFPPVPTIDHKSTKKPENLSDNQENSRSEKQKTKRTRRRKKNLCDSQDYLDSPNCSFSDFDENGKLTENNQPEIYYQNCPKNIVSNVQISENDTPNSSLVDYRIETDSGEKIDAEVISTSVENAVTERTADLGGEMNTDEILLSAETTQSIQTDASFQSETNVESDIPGSNVDMSSKTRTKHTSDSGLHLNQNLGAIGSERKGSPPLAHHSPENHDASEENTQNVLSQCWDFTILLDGEKIHSVGPIELPDNVSDSPDQGTEPYLKNPTAHTFDHDYSTLIYHEEQCPLDEPRIIGSNPDEQSLEVKSDDVEDTAAKMDDANKICVNVSRNLDLTANMCFEIRSTPPNRENDRDESRILDEPEKNIEESDHDVDGEKKMVEEQSSSIVSILGMIKKSLLGHHSDAKNAPSVKEELKTKEIANSGSTGKPEQTTDEKSTSDSESSLITEPSVDRCNDGIEVEKEDEKSSQPDIEIVGDTLSNKLSSISPHSPESSYEIDAGNTLSSCEISKSVIYDLSKNISDQILIVDTLSVKLRTEVGTVVEENRSISKLDGEDNEPCVSSAGDLKCATNERNAVESDLLENEEPLFEAEKNSVDNLESKNARARTISDPDCSTEVSGLNSINDKVESSENTELQIDRPTPEIRSLPTESYAAEETKDMEEIVSNESSIKLPYDVERKMTDGMKSPISELERTLEEDVTNEDVYKKEINTQNIEFESMSELEQVLENFIRDDPLDIDSHDVEVHLKDEMEKENLPYELHSPDGDVNKKLNDVAEQENSKEDSHEEEIQEPKEISVSEHSEATMVLPPNVGRELSTESETGVRSSEEKCDDKSIDDDIYADLEKKMADMNFSDDQPANDESLETQNSSIKNSDGIPVDVFSENLAKSQLDDKEICDLIVDDLRNIERASKEFSSDHSIVLQGVIDNINQVSWKESPFPVDDEVMVIAVSEVEEITCKSDASTNTSNYDFNVLYIGGTSEPEYKVLNTHNKSINNGVTNVPEVKPPLKLMFDKSSMTGVVDILSSEGNLETRSETDRMKDVDELVNMFPNVSREDVTEIYKNLCNCDFDWAVDVLLDGVPETVTQYTRIESPKIVLDGIPSSSSSGESGSVSECLSHDSTPQNEILERLKQSSSWEINDTNVKSQSHVSSPRKKKDKHRLSEVGLELKRQIEEKMIINEDTYHPHILRVKRWKNGEPDLITSEEPVESNVQPEPIIESIWDVEDISRKSSESTDDLTEDDTESEETMELNLGRDFIRVLENEFGIPGFDIPDGLLPHIQVKRSMAQQLHTLWIESMIQQINAQQEQLDKMIETDAEFARSLEQEEARAITNQVVPNLQEIMDMEMALAIYTNDMKKQWKRETPNDMASRLTRQRLHEMFPRHDPETLDEILNAHNGNFKETVDVLEASTGETLNRSDTLEKQKNLIDRVTKESMESTKQASKSSHSSPIIVVNPDLSYSGNTELPTLTYDTAMEEAEISRKEAQWHLSLRNENFNKATEAFRKGNRDVAGYYSQMAKLHSKKMEYANATAASAFLAAQEYIMNKENTLDLHNLYVAEALQALDMFLDHQISRLNDGNKKTMNLYIITGRGARSSRGLSRIKPAVSKKLASKKNIRFFDANPGCLKVILHRTN